MTLQEFRRLVAVSKDKLIHNGQEIRQVAYIYCVGSRQPGGDHTYCSRYCCTAAIHASLHAKKKFGTIRNYHFTRGVRTYGKQESLYTESLRSGDIYLQSFEDSPPEVCVDGGKTVVKVKDILTGNKELAVEADLVVLITGMVPRNGDMTGKLFKLPAGRDGFFNEIHMKLRPVETVIDGVTIAGTCQGPKNITESVNSALTAAVKSFSYVSKGQLETEPVVAGIDPQSCTWCDACERSCPFDAITRQEEGDRAFGVVNTSVCKGCGMCLPVCPSDAIELVNYSNQEIESMINALAGEGAIK